MRTLAIIERLLFRRAATPSALDAATLAPRRTTTARHLAEAAEREHALGRLGISNRLGMAAIECDRDSAPAAEALARVRLAHGDVSSALVVIENAPVRTSALRLLRIVALMRLGRKDEAHHDLLQWSRLPSAPEEARLLLALLEWESGDTHAAAIALLRNVRRREDSRSLTLLAAIAAGGGRCEQATAWAARIGTNPRALAQRRLFAATLGIPVERLPSAPAPHEVETLAVELRRSEAIIPAIVAGLEVRPEPDLIRLVLASIEMILPLLASEAAAIEAAARLQILLGDEQIAQERIRHALERHPMHAGLAILARRSAAPRSREHSRDVLATIAHHEAATRQELAA